MGLKYAIHQKDRNAKALKKTAEKLGLSVFEIGRPVDWLVTGFGLAVACEVKTEKGKLRPAQKAFLEAIGAAGWVLRNENDVRILCRRLRGMALVLGEEYL